MMPPPHARPKSASAVTCDSAVAETHSPDDCEDSLRGGGDADAGTHSPDSHSPAVAATHAPRLMLRCGRDEKPDSWLWEWDSRQNAWVTNQRLVKRRKIESRDWLSSIGEKSLIAIFFHFRNPFDAKAFPMVGTCRKVLLIWRKKRRDFALAEAQGLMRFLREAERSAVAGGDLNGGVVEVRELYLPLCDVIDLIR